MKVPKSWVFATAPRHVLASVLASVLALGLMMSATASIAQDSTAKSTAPQKKMSAAQIQAALEARLKQSHPDTAHVTGVHESVSASARCAQGYVLAGHYSVSSADVKIVSQQKLDCEDGRCRAYQVDAKRDTEEPFDLTVSVTCSS